MTDLDRAAEIRIAGIAEGTPSPFKTMMRATEHTISHGAQNEWVALLYCMIDLYYAADSAQVRDAVDDAHEALQALREHTYSGPSRF